MKKKTTKGKGKKDLLDTSPEGIEDALKIVSGVGLNSITLKAMIWMGSITVKTTLPKSYHQYKLLLELDESPYLQRIADLERDLDSTLFREDKSQRRSTNERIGEINNNLAQLRKECEVIEFSVQVDSLKYSQGQTILSMRLPDDIVEPFNRQKSRLQLYKISLIPVL